MSRQRWIPLQGAVNARDVGGLPTLDGGRLAAGRLLRSDNLQDLTPADVSRLVDGHGLRLVIDLRTDVEVRKEGPTPLHRTPGVEHRHLSLLPELGRRTDAGVDIDDTRTDEMLPWQRDRTRSFGGDRGGAELVAAAYVGYLVDRPDNVTAALREITELDDGAALVHCAAGKDRTGVVVALALSVAGVPREAIVADYVATADVIEALVARLLASPTYAEDLAGRPVDSHRPVAEAMWHLLGRLDTEHGGPGGWLTDAGFGPSEQTALRRRLVG